MSKKIVSFFSKEDKIFRTQISGPSIEELEKFCDATRCQILDFWDNEEKKFFVPGALLISMFRHVIKKMYKENKQFPLKEISSFYGTSGGTLENRVYIKDNLVYEFCFLSKLRDKLLSKVEILRSEPKDIVLQGLFQFQ